MRYFVNVHYWTYTCDRCGCKESVVSSEKGPADWAVYGTACYCDKCKEPLGLGNLAIPSYKRTSVPEIRARPVPADYAQLREDCDALLDALKSARPYVHMHADADASMFDGSRGNLASFVQSHIDAAVLLVKTHQDESESGIPK